MRLGGSAALVASVPQMRAPDAFVSSVSQLTRFVRSASAKIPPVNVDVLVTDELIIPPVTESPLEEARPPEPTERPPVRVEVALLVMLSLPDD